MEDEVRVGLLTTRNLGDVEDVEGTVWMNDNFLLESLQVQNDKLVLILLLDRAENLVLVNDRTVCDALVQEV